MARSSHNTVKKYIHRWNALNLSIEEFQSKSDAELHILFCVAEGPSEPNLRLDELEKLLPTIYQALTKKGMTSLKQWQKYIESHPDGYGLTQFRYALQRYRMITNPSMRMEHKAGDKMFIDYTGNKLWIYPPGEQPRQVEVFVAILGCSLYTYAQAAAIHEDVEHYIRKVLESKRYVDQANKSCSGILNFARKVGGDRLAAACRLADSYGKYNYLEIQDILQHKSEQIDLPEETADIPEHENIRGREYYK